MEKIKKDINDSNKEIVKQLSGLFTKLSNSIDQSYYSGQKSAYEEMLIWFKNSQNKSMRFIPPKNIKNYLLEKGAKSKNLNDKKNNKDKEDNLKRTNKANFNYLYYNQTFNIDNNTDKRNHIEYNVYPTSVEKAIYNNNNKSSQPLTLDFNGLNLLIYLN